MKGEICKMGFLGSFLGLIGASAVFVGADIKERWDDKRTERYIHAQIMKRYSILPNFAHKVYGCPKVQWKKEVA